MREVRATTHRDLLAMAKVLQEEELAMKRQQANRGRKR